MSERDPTPIVDHAVAFRRSLGLPDDYVPRPSTEFDLNAAVRRQRMETFRRLCPPEFHARIDEKLLPKREAWAEADRWDGSFPGVWLWGEATGDAKSRMLWRKFGMVHVERGLSVQRVSGLNLAEEYADSKRAGRTANFYRHLCGTDAVMLDDLDKMTLPERGLGFSKRDEAETNARFLRELFDEFYEQHTPVLVTANRSIAWFGERCGETAERRMRAVCREIVF